jgi:hypothetical protein
MVFGKKHQRRVSLLRAGLPDGKRWPKTPIWVNFGGSCNVRCWYILLSFGRFYDHLVYFVAIW